MNNPGKKKGRRNNFGMNEQEGIAVGRSFAMFKHYNIDGNKEMVAIGTMNIVGSCFSCYLTTGLNNKQQNPFMRKPNWFWLPNHQTCRPIFPIGCELQCRMQNRSIKRSYGDCSDVDIVVLDSSVPLHSSCGAFFHHHFRHAWPHRLRSCYSLVEGW